MKEILLLLFLLPVSLLAIGQQKRTSDSLQSKYKDIDVFQAMDKQMKIDSAIDLPDSIVLAPWHMLDVYIILADSVRDFKSISIDIRVRSHIPDGLTYFIAPFNSEFNAIPFYCGVQTASGGKNVQTGIEEQIGRGAIFSRWYERSRKALKTTGYYASSDKEGDFISVRNKFHWDTGSYRITLYKSAIIPGKPLPAQFDTKSVMFSWGQYVHSWVTMSVTNLKTNRSMVVGSLAFPGKQLAMPPLFGLFFEQYGKATDFSLSDRRLEGALSFRQQPFLLIDFVQLTINGQLTKPAEVVTYYNLTHHPEQKKMAMPMPRFAEAQYDKDSSVLHWCIGKIFP